jgi:signal transduction histidine kinase
MDLSAAAQQAAASLAPVAAGRGLGLEPDLAPAPIVGDEARLRQLVRILLDNAIRHSAPGGTVRMTVRPRAGGATLVVEDEGTGIRPADLPHLFERFWRAPGAPSGGTGLGLAIAAWIVDRHRGTITAGNREPHGARFEVQLPAGRG